MDGHRASIKYKQIKSNLVNLPSNLSNLLYNANIQIQDVIIEIVVPSGKKSKSYAGWSGMSSSAIQTVEIDPVFAQALNIKDDEKIVVNLKINNYEAANINLEPVTSSDWELVELHAQAIEDTLLSQTRCVSLNQIIVVYPNQTTSAKLIVTDIGSKDHQYAKISPYCEIAIAPKVREKKESTKSTKSLNGKSSSTGPSRSEDYSTLPVVLKRGISLPHNLYPVKNTGYELYANLSEIDPSIISDYVAVSVIPSPNDKSTKSAPQSTEENGNKVVVALKENKRIIAKLVDYPTGPANTVALSTKLAVALNVELQIGNIIAIKPAIKTLPRRPTTFTVHPYVTQTKKSTQINSTSLEKKELQVKVNQLTEFLYNQDHFYNSAVTNFIKIPIIPQILPLGGLLKFKKNDDTNAWIKPYSIESKKPIKIEIGEDLLRTGSFIQQEEEKEEIEAIGLDTVVDDIIESFTTSKNTGTLVYGNSGSGKSLVLKLVSKRISSEHGFFAKYISCESLMNENFNSLSKNHIFKWLQQCSWNKPSLLILDNVDKILNVEMEHLDASKSNQLTEYLISNLEKIHSQHNSNLSILLSASSKEAINKLLLQCHLIENFHHLSPPDKALRYDILNNYIVNTLGCKVSFDLMDLVTETEGYLPNDLKILSDRIYHEVLFSSSDDSSPLTVTKAHFEKSVQGYTPSNLRGVKLQKSTISWSDIGGLKEAKNILLETLEWPTKYAPIFANCPLRLRSGILLYGYPGCGKTLLASAIAGQCGLNFISIKGPEILNKYIGASEQSVRELFERAQAAKPCILFFDEFDSIAPKRGHDSTGVTDRVVNQMLTQMDGAEGLDGVYVLAATSRPDLIDSALLRPGRLDKSVICDMPDYDDRLDILKSITEKMDLGNDVNLEDIAERTAGFSGADMQGLGYNAYLKAVHVKLAKIEQESSEPKANDNDQETIEFFQVNSEKLKNAKLRPADRVKMLSQIQQLFSKEEDDNSGSKKTQEDTTVYITQENFEESLKETKPSISFSEKRKLEKIYSQFVSARDGNMPDGSASNEIGGRTTLM
ncbi:AAA ATPase, peroxisomal biogenesis [Scheffersomyces xylosifermentans]|uniref:AAA ATPase, peroxisomal biogenesis n=1 Tax=Scheffersomyces xylosifermentans TaxID=1304137 RepID=UPI00315DF99D